MRAIFGVAINSISAVANSLQSTGYKIFVPVDGTKKKDIEGVETAQIILLGSVALFKRLAGHINKKAVVVIFDSPINLCCVRNIRYLDCAKNSLKDGLSYKWQFQPIDYDVLKRAVSRKKQVKWGTKDVDLLPVIIDGKVDGKFMEHVNNLVYNSTNHTNRNAISHTIFELATGVIKPKQASSKIKKFLDMNPVRAKLVDSVVNTMSSEYGTKLVAALKERNRIKQTGKAVQYKKLEKQFGIMASDLKGVIALEED